MNTKKRIDGDYTIETINGGDRVIINTTAVAVTGNLEVSGNLTYINTEQLDVKDPFILTAWLLEKGCVQQANALLRTIASNKTLPTESIPVN